MGGVAIKLKKYFIPHPGNDHKPHFLRPQATLLVLAGILASEIIFLANILIIYPASDYFASILPAVLIEETNNRRESRSLNALKVNPLLESAAQMKAEDMAAKGYFAHVTPDGKAPWYFLDKAGYIFSMAGENLAVNFFDSKDVAEAWMNSEKHRANILNNNYTEIGIAAAQGTYQGRNSVFVVQFFGTPAVATAPIVPAKLKIIPEAEAESFTEVINENAIEISSTAPLAEKPSTVSVLASEPRATINYFYFILFGVVTLALLLKIFVKIRIQHPVLIANGILLLLVIATAYLSNELLSKSLLDIV